MADETIMPPTGTITRASAAITRPANSATSVATVLAATPPVAATLAPGRPRAAAASDLPGNDHHREQPAGGAEQTRPLEQDAKECAGGDQLHRGACGGDDELPSETQPLAVGDRSGHRDQQQRYDYPAPARHGQPRGHHGKG